MKKYKPTSPAKRHMQTLEKEDVVKTGGYKKLVVRNKKHSGRNSDGKITVRHRGGGSKRKYRLIDFKGEVRDVPGVVEEVQYDPNRSANICLIKWNNGKRTYVLQAKNMKKDYKIEYGENVEVKDGNRLPLRNIPVGLRLHNVEIKIKKGGQIARSAGGYVTLKAKHGKYATLEMPSDEIRLIHIDCEATVGEVGNSEFRNKTLGKAGKSRMLGRRPRVRGSVMNPVDHPHGGGEGKAPIGRPSPVSPTGVPALGYKTRDKKKNSTKLIMSKARR
ncbi:50S ribosomal protein L2 [Candidatus Margulisiibacteriota bacterium]